MAEPVVEQGKQKFRGWRWEHVLLGVLVLFGALLRLWQLDHPALWLDEAATYARTCGTFQQLMEQLADDGFMPLHYWLTWAIGQWLDLSPGIIRMPPTIAGVVAIPGMYFLARQLSFSRSAALTAAALVATSAWGFTYSRDAKMYSQTWACIIWSWVAFLSLLRQPANCRWHRSLAIWFGWVLMSVLAVGFHASAGLSLAVQLLSTCFVFCGSIRLHWTNWVTRSLGLVAGASIVAAVPAVYYSAFNSYLTKAGVVSERAIAREGSSVHRPNAATNPPGESVAPQRNRIGGRQLPGGGFRGFGRPGRNQSGIEWVDRFNRGISPGELVLNTFAGFGFGVQWPRDAVDPGSYSTKPPPWFGPAVHAACAGVIGLMLLGVFSWKRAEWPGWPAVWILGLWLVLPAYGFYYCRSFEYFSSPTVWISMMWRLLGWWWLLAAGVAVITAFATEAAGIGWWARLSRACVAGLLILTAVATIAYAAYLKQDQWPSAIAGSTWFWWLLPAWAGAVIGMGWHASADNLKSRVTNAGMLVLGTALIFGLCYAAYWGWHWRRESQPAAAWNSIWMPRYVGILWPPVVLAMSLLLMRLPGRWLRVMAVTAILAANLSQIAGRLLVNTEPPLHEFARDIVESKHEGTRTHLVAGVAGHGSRWLQMSGISLNYHLHQASGRKYTPVEVFGGKIARDLFWVEDLPMEQVKRNIAEKQDRVDRVVWWQRYDNESQSPASILAELGDGWKVQSTAVFTQYQFWTWRRGSTWARTEFVRIGVTTRPART